MRSNSALLMRKRLHAKQTYIKKKEKKKMLHCLLLLSLKVHLINVLTSQRHLVAAGPTKSGFITLQTYLQMHNTIFSWCFLSRLFFIMLTVTQCLPVHNHKRAAGPCLVWQQKRNSHLIKKSLGKARVTNNANQLNKVP